MGLLISSAYSSNIGSAQIFSPAAAPAAMTSAPSASSLVIRPVVVVPRATAQAPVSVATSISGARPRWFA